MKTEFAKQNWLQGILGIYMKKNKWILTGIWIALSVFPAVALTGCGEKKMQVLITEGRAETRVEAAEGQTVEELLRQAEITVNGDDVIVPGLEERVTKEHPQIQISRCAKVKLVEGEKVFEMELTGGKVSDVLAQFGVTVEEHDYLNHDQGAYVTDGMEICVVHRLAVTLNIDGEVREYLTKAEDVEGFLEEQNIALDKKDRVKPERTTGLKEGERITVERVSVKEIVEKEAVAFETEVEYSNSMYSDETVEKTPGIEGEKEVTYQVTYVDGKEESRKAVSEKILKEPVNQVVTQGTKKRRRIVSRQQVPDCDGSGHGYYIITWSDGTVEYQDY